MEENLRKGKRKEGLRKVERDGLEKFCALIN